MSDASVHYGVTRLVLINSGKYSYADLDLTAPVHLAAPNNRGKSTLVNALQFLYVDELRAMRFGSRSHDDTRRHYFGEDPSYIVFECMTPLGPKCLLVAGQGPLNNCQFIRFVYDGKFNLDDFRNAADELHSLEEMRAKLAGRSLAELKPGNLWEVLGDARVSSAARDSLPRMNILPIRTRDEYRSFREAFIRLLALTNVSARELRELLITCHARDITCRKIDVAIEHREEFERAERAERAMQFSKAVVVYVDEGRMRRDAMAVHSQQLRLEVGPVALELASAHGQIGYVETDAIEQGEAIQGEEAAIDSRVAELNQQLGAIGRDIVHQQAALDRLNELHERWSLCTAEMLDMMRANSEALHARINRLKEDIEQAGRLDVSALRRRVHAIQEDLNANQRTLANWDTRTVNKLREMSLSGDDVQQLFRVLNPRLADLSIGVDVRIIDADQLQFELRSLRDHIDGDKYAGSSIEIDLSHINRETINIGATREQLQHDIAAKTAGLTRAQEQLRVAEDQVRAQQELQRANEERSELDGRLGEYDRYVKMWSERAGVSDELQRLNAERDGILAEIAAQTEAKEKCGQRRKDLTAVSTLCRDTLSRLDSSVDLYNQLQDEADLDVPLVIRTDVNVACEDVLHWDNVRPRVDKLMIRLEEMQASVRDVAQGHRRLMTLQKQITEESRQHQGQTVYFSEPEDDWNHLFELVDSLVEQENAVEQAWSSLFTRLGAKLDGIKQSVAEIRQAVRAINRGLADYRVSNLRSVQLEVVLQTETYSLIETLTSEGGIFQDHEKIDRAKDQMRRWIRDGKVIQLDDLFAVHIKVHDLDRDRPTEAKTLDEIGSTGTGMTAKAMVFIQLVRAVVSESRYRLHFYLDETGQLDENNLAATTRMAVDCGVIPITADPDVRIEPLAHPTVTVYSLGQNREGKFYIDRRRTCQGRRKLAPVTESEA